MDDFGFTNDPARYVAVNEYREAARADGWTCEPTYPSEPVERAARLTRDGFVMQIISRQTDHKFAYECSVHIWGPDKLQIRVPQTYAWDAIQAALRTCTACGATNVDTQRYSFAGRCCAACIPTMREKHERPGWTK